MLAALNGPRQNVLTWIARLPAGASPEEVRDLYNATAALGRIMAELDVSRVLAAETLDNLAEAAALGKPEWLPGAKAALLEGFVARRESFARDQERARWREPTVALGQGRVAVFAAFESEDDAETRAWADALVAKLVKRRVRSMVLAGRERPLAALLDAAAVGGISTETCVDEVPPPANEGRKKRRLWPFGLRSARCAI